jgi:hypothetical protein
VIVDDVDFHDDVAADFLELNCGRIEIIFLAHLFSKLSIHISKRKYSRRNIIGMYASNKYTFYTPWSESASELYRPSDSRLSAK